VSPRATTTTDHDDEKASGSSEGGVVITARSDKRQARPPTDHFKRSFPNHTYPIRHKLKDCGMMKNFMIFGSLTRCTELDEDPSSSDMMPFLREDAIMMVYGGRPPPQEGATCLP
jgi:hypothetical protein